MIQLTHSVDIVESNLRTDGIIQPFSVDELGHNRPLPGATRSSGKDDLVELEARCRFFQFVAWVQALHRSIERHRASDAINGHSTWICKCELEFPASPIVIVVRVVRRADYAPHERDTVDRDFVCCALVSNVVPYLQACEHRCGYRCRTDREIHSDEDIVDHRSRDWQCSLALGSGSWFGPETG